ncbi:hypothetical protein OG802_33640 [Streptomyces sp. NBC_00704]|uniref:hypothetical protein n=1 Tax=Streptomyces sp. NBC_00704 TaxID=2975809 RepID=UPI002E357F48|nr:hypothetical protein [Streptomyces sp. NBC_00704]
MSVAGKSLAAAAVGLAAGAFVVVRRAKAHPSGTAAGDRWLTVTINRAPQDVQADKLPAPLHEYGDRVETRVRPAPGDRGTELAVRLRQAAPDVAYSAPARLAGVDPRQDLRRALRDAKALLEAGEVLQPDTPPTTHDTPGGKLVGLLSRRADGEGVL